MITSHLLSPPSPFLHRTCGVHEFLQDRPGNIHSNAPVSCRQGRQRVYGMQFCSLGPLLPYHIFRTCYCYSTGATKPAGNDWEGWACHPQRELLCSILFFKTWLSSRQDGSEGGGVCCRGPTWWRRELAPAGCPLASTCTLWHVHKQAGIYAHTKLYTYGLTNFELLGFKALLFLLSGGSFYLEFVQKLEHRV